MEEIDYAKDIPNTPPEGIIPWLMEKGYFEDERIVYRADYEYNPLTDRREKVVKCHCSACERDYIMPYVPAECGCSMQYAPVSFGFFNELTNETVFTGDKTQCPYCGTDAEVIHIGQYRKNKTIETFSPLTIHKINGHAVLLEWLIQYKLNKQGNTYITTQPYEGAVILDKKIIRICGYMNYGMGCISWRDRWEQRKRYYDGVGEKARGFIYPFDADVFNGTSMENSKFAEYISSTHDTVYPVSYLYLYLKHKNVENLVTQGMGKLVNQLLAASVQTYYAPPQIRQIKMINWKESKPHLMLGLTKEELRFIKKEKWDRAEIEFYQKVKMHGVKPEDMKTCKKEGLYSVESLLAAAVQMPIMKTLKYLQKQRKKFDTSTPNCRYIRDYWKMAKDNGRDMTDESIIYPHNLINRHDAEAVKNKKEKSKQLDKKFKARLKELNKYCFEYKGLSIHPAHSSGEMINEGQKLCHCVGSYVKSHAEGETTLFFIRHIDHPRTPYFTLEFDLENNEVLQNRGMKNCDRTPEVKEFEKKWLKFVKSINKKKTRKAA